MNLLKPCVMNSKEIPIYQLENLGRAFGEGADKVDIFSNLNLAINRGETLAIVGASGSGKSTLLHLMGALDRPSSGKVLFEGVELSEMKPEEQAHFRNRSLGFVFQFHHLLPEFTALENVAIPGFISGMPRDKALEHASRLLDRVGLSHRKESKPATLSGGERQRAAIARALLMGPKAILADEPTGNLDEGTGQKVIDLMLDLNRELQTTLVIVTHNLDLAGKMDRALELKGGALYEKAYN